MKIYKTLLQMLKYFAIFVFITVFIFSVWIAREVLLSSYEPRGFTSEYDRDISCFFPKYSIETKSNLLECYRETLEVVTGFEEVTDFTGAEIYFDSSQINSWTFFFALKKIGSFHGELKIFSSGYAEEVYVHRHFAEKYRSIKQETAEQQLIDIQRKEFNSAVSYAVLTAGKTCYYDSHGKLLQEYLYE